MGNNQKQKTSGRYMGALLVVGVGIPIPILAMFFTVFGYLVFSALAVPNSIITFLPLLGLIFTIIVWLLLAFLFLPMATARGGKLTDYELIQGDLSVLKAQFDAVMKYNAAHIKAQQPAPPEASDKAQQPAPPEEPDEIAMAEIQSNLDSIDLMLSRNGLTWVMRTGYINVWNLINKANEAMIDVLSPEQVIEGANYDILSLTGSKVPDFKDLIKQLEKAINILSSGSDRSRQSSEQNQDTSLQQNLARAMIALLTEKVDSTFSEKPLYKRIWDSIRNIFRRDSLQQNNASTLQQPMAQALLALLKKAVEQTGSSAETRNKEQEARSTIRKARSALHNFTNERWDALVRARNQLMGAALLASIFTYLLVVLAILVSVVPGVVLPSTNFPAILGQITLFYLLGAVVGLFSRALSESNEKDTDIAHSDDYGLTAARILVTPMLSGLAALVGVLLVAMLSITLSTTISHGATTFSTFAANIYNFNVNPQNLVFAAIFGYLPSLVIGLLKQQTNKIQSEIHGSGPAD
jgi:hypothetical protein